VPPRDTPTIKKSSIVTNGKRTGMSPFHAVPVAVMLVVLVLRLVACRRAARRRKLAGLVLPSRRDRLGTVKRAEHRRS
jgi:Flp pilus assembly protein TadB